MKNYKVEIPIKDYLEYNLNQKERIEVYDTITGVMTESEFNSFVKYIFNDLLICELEFDKRENIVNALNTLFNEYEKQ